VVSELYICDHVDVGDDGIERMCGKEYSTPRALAIHRAAHDRQKVKCPKCGRPVMYLETHMAKVHQIDTEAVRSVVHDLIDEFVRLTREVERLRAENIRLRQQQN
jgi:hypothetical protein